MRATATAREWAGLAVLVLPCLLVSLDAEVLNLAAPSLTAALRPSNVQLLWILDSYVFVLSGTLIGAGVLGDRIGRRRLLLAGSAAFALASLAAAFATSPAQLIAARVLMGLTGATLMPSTLALIRAMFADPRERGIALGVWSAGFSLGGVGAPLIGGVLLEHFWWGSVFVIAVPATVLLLILGPILLPESRDRSATGFDWPGALLSLFAVLTFVYGLKRLAASGVDLLPLAAVAVAGALGGLFLRRQRRHSHPLLDLSIFQDVRVTVALVANALSFFVLYGTQFAIGQYLQLVLGMTPLRAGLWSLPSVTAYLLASLFGPGLTRWFPAGRVIAAGLAAMTVGFAVLALAGAAGLPAVVAGAVIFSIGLAPAYILTTDLVVSAVRPERAGMAAAVTETGTELGGALGIAVLGSVGVAAYRHELPGTLVDALTRAATLPAAAGEQLRQTAVHAYGNAFVLMSVAAAVVVALAALLAAAFLRPAPTPAQPRLAAAAPVQASSPAATPVQASSPAPASAQASSPAAASASSPAPVPTLACAEVGAFSVTGEESGRAPSAVRLSLAPRGKMPGDDDRA